MIEQKSSTSCPVSNGEVNFIMNPGWGHIHRSYDSLSKTPKQLVDRCIASSDPIEQMNILTILGDAIHPSLLDVALLRGDYAMFGIEFDKDGKKNRIYLEFGERTKNYNPEIR